MQEAFAWSEKFFVGLAREEKLLAPHPAGSGVHRGYSWPGLEKVSNLIGDEEDAEEIKKAERSVTDVKVSRCVCGLKILRIFPISLSVIFIIINYYYYY